MLNSSLDIEGDAITPTHPDYDSSIARWAKNAERKAQVVVFVKDAEDIAKCLAHAKASDLSIAIRGGGHNSAGASSAEGGLVIDLSRYLNRVRIDEENRVAYVGGGALWRDVDAEAMKHGLATVGGTVNHVSGPSSNGIHNTNDWIFLVRRALGGKPLCERSVFSTVNNLFHPPG